MFYLTNFLIVPKIHYETILDVEDNDTKKDLFKAVSEIAKKYDIAENGFRLINNCKE